MKTISFAVLSLLVLGAHAQFKASKPSTSSSVGPSSSSSSVYVPPSDLSQVTSRVYFNQKFVPSKDNGYPMGMITVGGQQLFVSIDPHSPESVIKIDLHHMDQMNNGSMPPMPPMPNETFPLKRIPGMPNMGNSTPPLVEQFHGYNPMSSSTLEIDDPLRYYGGSMGSVGYWGNDFFGFSMTDFNLTKQFSQEQDFVGAIYGPLMNSQCEGTIGLGLGNPKYGHAFMDNIKSIFGDRFVERWSYVQGPFMVNQTSILIGGSQKGFNSSFFNYYNVSKPNTWTINASRIAVQKVGKNDVPNQPIYKYQATDLWSVFNSSVNAYTFVDITSNVILLPNATFQNISAVWKTQTPNLKCNNTGCFSTQVCSALNTISDIVFMFGQQTYTLSNKDFLMDLDFQGCYIAVGVNTASATTVLGQPFFNGFTAQFDIKYPSIAFATAINSYSYVY